MQPTRIYSAPSLSEVIKQLIIYRLTGVLTIRPAIGTRQEEVSMAIVHGRPIRVRWGLREEEANDFILSHLNAWGEIHFIFHARQPQPILQLPPPAQPPHQKTARPQYSISPTQSLRVQETSRTPGPTTEMHIPILTALARGYPISNLPRYDRTIFLLINGRRTTADLAQLTKRSLAEVYGSLHRLRDQQLIEASL